LDAALVPRRSERVDNTSGRVSERLSRL